MKKWRNVEISTLIYHGSPRRKYGWNEDDPEAQRYLEFADRVGELAEEFFPGRSTGGGRFILLDEDGNES